MKRKAMRLFSLLLCLLLALSLWPAAAFAEEDGAERELRNLERKDRSERRRTLLQDRLERRRRELDRERRQREIERAAERRARSLATETEDIAR